MKHAPFILHIPHASTLIPSNEGYLDDTLLFEEIDLLTDWYTDELFIHPQTIPLIAPFSRIFCDVERFREDALEPMAVKGMSLTYTHTDKGKELRAVSEALRKKIEENYYDPHHQTLTKLVEEQLKMRGEACIIDCHSYPDIPLQRDIDQTRPRPDFNIGTDPFHTPAAWIKNSEQFFSKRGYTLGIDWPYTGTMVPMEYYKRDARVCSIMLEVNRKLYLKENSTEKSDKFNQVATLIGEWMEALR